MRRYAIRMMMRETSDLAYRARYLKWQEERQAQLIQVRPGETEIERRERLHKLDINLKTIQSVRTFIAMRKRVATVPPTTALSPVRPQSPINPGVFGPLSFPLSPIPPPRQSATPIPPEVVAITRQLNWWILNPEERDRDPGDPMDIQQEDVIFLLAAQRDRAAFESERRKETLEKVQGLKRKATEEAEWNDEKYGARLHCGLNVGIYLGGDKLDT